MYKEWMPEPSAKLVNHARRFEKRIETVTEGIYVAVGYALGNSVLIVTGEGNIIIDTTESLEAAREIQQEFQRLSPQPTRAVIYTHGHPDHIWGTSAFVDEETEIIAHAKFMEFFNEQYNQLWPILRVRGVRQFGAALPGGYVACSGIGPFLRSKAGASPGLVFPTKVFDDQLELTVGDERLLLVHAPGETEDQIYIWLPDRKVLFCGDNYYPAFPNLYTIRGTSPRPVRGWIHSLDKMRDLGAEYLVGSHAEPVRGAAGIQELLTLYRDAIQYVHDAVVRGADQGKTPEQLVEEIKLPAHLSVHPELLELYGQISWAVRAIFNGYLGWFDGNAATLDPLSPAERAQKLIVLAGGVQTLLAEAEQGLGTGEYQWAAEIADMLLAVRADDSRAREIKAKALWKLGERVDNSNARSYYLTQALELAGELQLKSRQKVDRESAHKVPLDQLMSNMAISLDPEDSRDQVIRAGFQFTDSLREYRVIVRRGIAEIRPGLPEKPSLVVRVTEDLWKEIALGVIEPKAALQEGLLRVDGSMQDLTVFLGLFKSRR